MTEKIITSQLWDYMEIKKNKTKIAKKVYDWMQLDNIDAVIEYSGTWWVDLTSPSRNYMPNYVFNYLKKHYQKMGLTYIWEI